MGRTRWRERRRVRLGDAVIRLGQRDAIGEVMTNLAPDTGENDFDTLSVLARHRKVGTELLLGVYGDVEQPWVEIEVGAGADPELVD